MVPALSSCIGVTATTPWVCDTSFCSVASRESLVFLAGEPSETATISGPFTPAPKFWEISSYACRAVVDCDSAPTSFCPRFKDSSGTASGIRITSAASPATTGWPATMDAHRAHMPFLGCGSLCRPRTRSELMCGPTIASVAGNSVTAARTATTTAIAAIKPIVVTSGMLATASDTSAIVTVPPANTTAPPDVAAARAIDSLRSRPSSIPRKWRVTMNSA